MSENEFSDHSVSSASSLERPHDHHAEYKINLIMCMDIIDEVHCAMDESVHMVSYIYDTFKNEGENYTGTITRAKANFKSENDDVEEVKRYIIKEDRMTGPRQGEGFFKIEIYMYESILPKMELLIYDAQLPSNEKLWCEYIGSRKYHTIILSDLCAQGFTLPNRQEGLNNEQAVLTVRNLAKFHAMSKVLIKKGTINKNDFGPRYNCLKEAPEVTRQLYQGGLKQLVKSMRQWPEEWKEVTDRVALQIDVILEKLRAMHEEPYDEGFEVLNHGDLWSCNMMFKNDDDGQPKEIRFVDYQVCHIHSLAWDLTHLLYTSLSSNLRQSIFDELITLYHSSLDEYMKVFNCKSPVPSLAGILREMDRFAYYSFVVTAINFPLATTHKTRAFSLERLIKPKRNCRKSPFSRGIYSTNKVIDTVGEQLKAMVIKGII